MEASKDRRSVAAVDERVEAMHGEGSRFVLVRVGLVGTLVAALIALAVPAPSHADFYRWVDDGGNVHFSNVPSEVPTGEAATRVPTRESTRTSERGSEVEDGEGDGSPVRSGVAGGETERLTPTQAALARSELNRELADAEAEKARLDRKLSDLARVRTRYAKESNPIVGGLLAEGAFDVRSPEEEALEEERKGVIKQIEEIQARIASLPAR